jgi:hypothetical protein
MGVRFSPSSSLTVVEQTIVLSAYGAVLSMDAVERTGARLVTALVVEFVAVPELLSETVTAHVKTSKGLMLYEERSIVLPVVKYVLPTLHSKVGETLSSGSEAAAEHSRMPSLNIDELGMITNPDNVGSVFSTVTLALDVAVAASSSVAVTVQEMESPTSVSLAETV